MKIQIDIASKVHPYEQVQRAIRAMVNTGELEPGRQLPTVRQLAGDLGIANNTVARAYRELELEGVIRSSGRRGTVVLARPVADGKIEQQLRDIVIRARSGGIDTATLLGIVAAALAE